MDYDERSFEGIDLIDSGVVVEEVDVARPGYVRLVYELSVVWVTASLKRRP